jgi:hypothetical protein
MTKKLSLIPMKTKVAEIQSIYDRAATQIVDILSALDPANFTSVESGQVLRRVQAIVLLLNDQVRTWASGAIKAAYQESAGVARTRLEMIGAKRLPEWKYNPMRHDKKIAVLTKTIMSDYFKANRTIEKTAKQYLAVISQAAAGVAKIQMQEFAGISDFPYIKRILKAARSIKWAEASLARTTVSRQIMNHLIKKIGGGDFINIKGRNYNLKAYSELVARTRMRESQMEAVKESMKQFDEDLVEIPVHDNPCEECAEYQGQVYSVSGDSDKYEELPDGGPPWHPNCEDVMNPVSENILAWRNK